MPRLIPVMGLIGAPLLITAVLATMFSGIAHYSSSLAAAATLPVAAWELSLGVWLVIKGFRSCPITTGIAATESPTRQDVAV